MFSSSLSFYCFLLRRSLSLSAPLLSCATYIIAFPLQWPWGEVALSQCYRGNTDRWSRQLSGSRTLSISALTSDKFQGTNCNGLINPFWGNGNIVNTRKLLEDTSQWHRDGFWGLLVSIVSPHQRKGEAVKGNFTAKAALTMGEREVSYKSFEFQSLTNYFQHFYG